MALVGASQLLAFADRMDELSQRAQSVLQRYDDHNRQAHSSGTFQGEGGDMNIRTSAEVQEAQMKIQTRFQNLNDLVRQNTHGYTRTDQQVAHSLAAIPGQLNLK
jgi:uncharacterized protein YukE